MMHPYGQHEYKSIKRIISLLNLQYFHICVFSQMYFEVTKYLTKLFFIQYFILKTNLRARLKIVQLEVSL